MYAKEGRSAAPKDRELVASWAFSRLPVLPAACTADLEEPPMHPAVQLPGGLQAKLHVGAVNDPLEHEADRAAEQVVRMHAQQMRRTPAAHEADRSLPAGPARPASAAGGAPAGSCGVLRAPGQPLDAATRAYFEPRFGHDFSRVRVHTDETAAQSARAVHALAFTVGHNLVFDAGQFAPQTSSGRRLLAHELAHVIQQAGTAPAPTPGAQETPVPVTGAVAAWPRLSPTPPGVQRQLRVTGKPKDVAALLHLLEPASGFTLKAEAKQPFAVSIVTSDPNPRSPALADQLKTIIDDPKQDAVLNVGPGRPGLDIGAFPGREGVDDKKKMKDLPLAQDIDVAVLEAIEKGSPGSGAALLLHEIVENYTAHNDAWREATREDIFGLSHDAALAAEARVAGELVGPGNRVASMQARGPAGDILTALDYENYYLVYQGQKNGIAHTVGRIKVASYKISGFTKGSNALPADKPAQAVIDKVIGDLAAHSFATVRIEGAASADPHQPSRMEIIRDEILSRGKANKARDFDIRDFHNFHLVNNDGAAFAQEVSIAVEEPHIGLDFL